MTTTDTLRRLTEETVKLQAMVASAPADHPARVACNKLAEFLPSASALWLECHETGSARTICNMIAKGDSVPGINAAAI